MAQLDRNPVSGGTINIRGRPRRYQAQAGPGGTAESARRIGKLRVGPHKGIARERGTFSSLRGTGRGLFHDSVEPRWSDVELEPGRGTNERVQGQRGHRAVFL